MTVPGPSNLVVVVGFGEEDALAGWYRQAAMDATATLAFIVALAGLTFLLLRQLTRQQLLAGNLARSEASYRRLVETATEGIVRVNAERLTTYVNPRMAAMLGYSEAEMLGKKVRDFVLEEDQARNLAMLEKMLASKSPVQYDLRFRRKDGSTLWTIASINAAYDEQGRYTGALAMITDISERAHAEEEVRRHLTRLRGLHAMDQAILAVQSRESIAAIGLRHLRELVPYWGAAVLTFDFAANRVVPLSVAAPEGSTYAPDPDMTLDDYGSEDIAMLRIGREQIYLNLGAAPVGSRRIEKLRAVGMRSYVGIPLMAEGELVGSMNLASDRNDAYSSEEIAMARSVADQMAIALRQAALREQVDRHAMELEQRVKERTAELNAANQELESFTGAVSHDLRAPARRIAGFANILLEESKGIDGNVTGMVQRIARSATRMNELIDDLLSLAHTGSSKMEKAEFDMNALVREVREELEPQVGTRKIEWNVAPMPAARGDAALIRVALQNLLGNAIKYSSKQPDAAIEVGSRQLPSGETEFFVRDNGAGFDMQYAAKLFKTFSRLHTETEFEGTGIGLATVHRIINRHGGRVRAEGKPGEGAEFSFTLD
jgi:PAS domain S-box-containing protein